MENALGQSNCRILEPSMSQVRIDEWTWEIQET